MKEEVLCAKRQSFRRDTILGDKGGRGMNDPLLHVICILQICVILTSLLITEI